MNQGVVVSIRRGGHERAEWAPEDLVHAMNQNPDRRP